MGYEYPNIKDENYLVNLQCRNGEIRDYGSLGIYWQSNDTMKFSTTYYPDNVLVFDGTQFLYTETKLNMTKEHFCIQANITFTNVAKPQQELLACFDSYTHLSLKACYLHFVYRAASGTGSFIKYEKDFTSVKLKTGTDYLLTYEKIDNTIYLFIQTPGVDNKIDSIQIDYDTFYQFVNRTDVNWHNLFIGANFDGSKHQLVRPVFGHLRFLTISSVPRLNSEGQPITYSDSDGKDTSNGKGHLIFKLY